MKKENEIDSRLDCCVTYENDLYEDITNALVTALEGGSNYWYNIDTMGFGWKKGIPHSIQIIEAVLYNDVIFSVYDIEDDGSFLGYLSLENVNRGVDMFLTEFKGSELGDVDGNLADVFFQYVIMGEVIYG